MGIRPGTFQRVLRKAVATCFPAAGAGTFGATVTVLTAGAFPNFETHSVRTQPANVGAETLTVNIFFNFSDGSTQNFQVTFASTNALNDMTLGNMLVNAYKDGVVLTSVTANCSSTIASSTASATINWCGVATE